MFTKFSFLTIFVVSCLTAPFSASADKPAAGGGSFFFPGDPLVDCGDFWILDNTLVRFSWKDFLDNDGNLVRTEAHYSFDDDLFHEDFPDGIHLFGNAQANHQWLIEDGEVTAHKVSGLPVGITVPGYGPLFFEAGMWIGVDGELVFVAGKHKDWVEEDFAAICDYFRNQ